MVQSPGTEPRCIDIPEVAERLGIGIWLARKLVMSGQIPSLKLGARRLVPVAAITRIVNKAMGSVEDNDEAMAQLDERGG